LWGFPGTFIDINYMIAQNHGNNKH